MTNDPPSVAAATSGAAGEEIPASDRHSDLLSLA